MEVIAIKLSIQSKEKDIIGFLLELKHILHSEEFNIDRDFTIIKSKKKSGKEQFSTPYTILDLEYDANDIIERLKELTIREYSETLVDKAYKETVNGAIIPFSLAKNIRNFL